VNNAHLKIVKQQWILNTSPGYLRVKMTRSSTEIHLTICLILSTVIMQSVTAVEIPWQPARTVDDAAPWAINPATLGVNYQSAWGYEFGGAHVQVANDALDLAIYKDYNGSYLSSADKDLILNRIMDENLSGSLSIQGRVATLRAGRLAYIMRAYASATGSIDKDFVELTFYENDLDREYFMFNKGHSLCMSSFGFSYGQKIAEFGGWQIAGGGGVQIIFPLKAVEVVESSGSVHTEERGISGSGYTVTRRSDGTGRGVSFDMGIWAAYELLEISITIRNFGPKIIWPEAIEERIDFQMDQWSFDQGEDGYESVDSTVTLADWKTELPTSVTLLAAAHAPWGNVNLSVNRGLVRSGGQRVETRFLFGTELYLLHWLRPRLGIRMGGVEDPSGAAGARLNLWHLHTDFFISGFKIPNGSSKGLTIGASLGLGEI